jgi:hypothetical protein
MNAAVVEQKPLVEQKPMVDLKSMGETGPMFGMPNPLVLQNRDVRVVTNESGPGRYIYSVFHTIMSLIAIYLSFRCNKGFEFGPFLVACCCPYIYIIYVLATKGTCGILEGESK